MEDREYWIALNLVPNVGKILFKRLLDYFGAPQKIFSASEKDLLQVDGVGEKIASSILSFQIESVLKKELSLIKKHNLKILILKDELYPVNLKAIFDPPPVLYVNGELLKRDNISIAIVGSRIATTYGKLTTERIARELALRGITIISGMARGIDTAAHLGALSGGGRTIAVLGCGLGIVYPPENKKLMQQIIECGAVISEFPIMVPPERMNFPIRNRIISGLSLGTVVVEAAARSGSLITADCALEQGREVFAVPGNISSRSSQGTNRLIKQGAKLIEKAVDILDELSPEIKAFLEVEEEKEETEGKNCNLSLTEDEKKIYNHLSEEPIHIDPIIEKVNLLPNKVLGALTMLEIKGLIKQLSGKMFIKIGK